MNLDKSFAFKGFKEELAIRYGKEKADKSKSDYNGKTISIM